MTRFDKGLTWFMWIWWTGVVILFIPGLLEVLQSLIEDPLFGPVSAEHMWTYLGMALFGSPAVGAYMWRQKRKDRLS